MRLLGIICIVSTCNVIALNSAVSSGLYCVIIWLRVVLKRSVIGPLKVIGQFSHDSSGVVT